MSANQEQNKFYFKEPRLNFTVFGRFLVRLIISAVYGFLAVGTFSLLLFYFKERGQLFWAGVLLFLFLADRFFDYKKADYFLRRSRGNSGNLANFLSPAAYNIIEHAYERALIAGGSFHLYIMQDLLGQKDTREAFIRLDIQIKEIAQKLDERLKKTLEKREQKEEILGKIEILVFAAYEEAVQNAEEFIEPRNLLVAAVSQNNDITGLFDLFSLKPADLREAVIFGKYRANLSFSRLPSELSGFVRRPRGRKRIMNRAWTARPTPMLDRYSADLTSLARMDQIGFMIGHEDEYKRLINALSRPFKPNALLVGEPGIGKGTIIANLARHIVKDEVPSSLFDKRLVELEIGSLVSSATADELSGRVKKIIDEILLANNIILYIPDIDNLVKTSGSGFLSAADLLLPEIKAGTFPVIGATYPREFKQSIEPQSDFAGAFEIIRVEEIKEADAVRILVYDSLILERQFKVFITFGAVRQAVSLAKKFFRIKPLPASAEDLLKEALAESQSKKLKSLGPDLVIEVAERRTKVPIQRAGDKEAEILLNMEKIIHHRLINQEEAVKAVSQALREYRSGLSRRGGPIATFLFVGPTGVGKTELSKILAKLQFGSEELLVRFDMSEYQDKQSIFRFIGSPDGNTIGMMTEAVKTRPYSLVLLDEFEKAHPDILNLFLQVFDDGRLTDNLGQTVDFQNTIIIATSNAHSNFIKEQIEKGVAIKEINVEIKKKLTEYFRPELLNRFSDIIVFRDLNLEEIGKIAGLQLKDLSDMLKDTQGIELNFEEAAVKKIAELGYDPTFGARPLRKAISEKIRGALAEKILKKEIGRGSTIKVIVENNELEFLNV
ncbi:MAG: ATP-dependent Clp protease ATP-binding subunit [Candidatus Brennerbacteria bacterium]|nr:ATP-dependent Clp protease ATP-binding subunit [Candidatus Brennerbacteria bacterium]